MGIFKAYDIRGVVPTQLDADLAYKIGNAFARFLKAKTLVVGQDMRTHSPEITDAVSQGMRDAGCNVIRLGLASTPMTYYGIATQPCDGGLVVTASHNPGEYNGMKLCSDDAKPISSANGIMDIERMCSEPTPAPVAVLGTETTVNILEEYADHVAKFAHVKRPIKIAVDIANGIVGHTLPSILKRTPNIAATTIFAEPDGSFPNHEANPLLEENLVYVQKLVRETGAEVGLAFDGDGDRCCFVDETGMTVSADLMTALMCRTFAAKTPGCPIIYDLRSSWVVKEEIAAAGAKPIRDRVGHSFIKATMRETGAVFGGELSGHFYFAENFKTDSGVIAMMSALSFLSAPENEGKTLSQLVSGLRRYASTGEINFEVEDKDLMIAELKSRYAAGRQDELDGITVEFGDLGDADWWWFNVRPSNTEPLLRLNLEGATQAICDARRDELMGLLGQPV